MFLNVLCINIRSKIQDCFYNYNVLTVQFLTENGSEPQERLLLTLGTHW